MTDFFVCFFPNKLLAAEIMQNSRDHVSRAQHLEVTYAFKRLKNSQLFEYLNDADIISMPMFAACYVKMEQIILFKRNRESAYVFWRQVSKFCENFSRKRKL